MSKYSKEGKATRPYDAGVPPVLTSSIGYSHASILPISGGRTAALVTLIDRLDLFFLNEFGVVTETRSVIPPNDGSVIKVLGFQQGFLRETTDGSFNAVVGLDQDEKATFEAFHELRIEGWSAAHQPVCLKLDRFGKVLSARAIPSSQGRHLFIDAADAVDDKSFAVVGSDLASADSRTFVGRCQFGSEQIRSEAWSIKIGKKADNADAILSLEDGSFLVGGTFGYQQVETGSVVEAGDAYVLHFHPDRPRQKPIRLGRPRADRASDLFRLGKQVYVAVSHDGPITHDEDRSGHTVIYRVALPPTASK